MNTCFAISFRFSRANIVVSKFWEKEKYTQQKPIYLLYVYNTYLIEWILLTTKREMFASMNRGNVAFELIVYYDAFCALSMCV